MSKSGDWRNGLRPKIADEVEYIQAAFRDPRTGNTTANPGKGDHSRRHQ